MPKMDRRERVEFLLSAEEATKLDKLCQGTGMTRSGYIRLLIRGNFSETAFVNSSQIRKIDELSRRQAKEIQDVLFNTQESEEK